MKLTASCRVMLFTNLFNFIIYLLFMCSNITTIKIKRQPLFNDCLKIVSYCLKLLLNKGSVLVIQFLLYEQHQQSLFGQPLHRHGLR